MTTPLICGIDEVGRGSLAGPLISVATLFIGHATGCPDVDDSKKMTPKRRERTFKQLCCSPFLVDFGIGQVSVPEINERGIDWANAESFLRAVNNLPTKPAHIIIDGVNGLKGGGHHSIQVEPKADGKYPVVSAASILAKVIRDAYMIELDSLYPGYRWGQNKGYGTQDHILGIKSLGATRFHRTRFISKIVSPQTGWSF